jgi:hypothetical protein
MSEKAIVFGAVGIFVIFAVYFPDFMKKFKVRFNRSYFHWGNMACMAVVIFSMLSMKDSAAWTVICYISWAAFIGIGIWQMVRYGFLWGLGVWLYNILTIVLVFFLLNTISNMAKRNKK